MQALSRRDFLIGAAAGGAMLGVVGAGALAQTDKFDLVIKGGEVLDTSQKLRARRDIGIRNAVIAALEPEIPEARANQTLDARGRLVLPGLVDMHTHLREPGFVPSEERHACASGGQGRSDCGADAAARAGDQRYSALQEQGVSGSRPTD